MLGTICVDSSGLLDFYDPCVRALWASLFPLAFLVTLALFYVLLWNSPVGSLFRNILPLEEAESLLGEPSAPLDTPPPSVWSFRALSFLAFMECAGWIALGSYNLTVSHKLAWDIWAPFVIAFTWLYAVLRPLLRLHTSSPPYDLFALYLVHLTAAIVELGAAFYDRYTVGAPLPQKNVLAIMATHFIVLFILISVMLCTPMAIPSNRVDKEKIGTEISPEDYTTLWGWITFSWIEPLIARGTKSTLNEADVWSLSPTLQSKLVFTKFNESKFKGGSLIRWIFFCNSLDIILDFILTLVSVSLNYASPFFLKRILDAITDPTLENRARAYIYACLAFVASILKAQADVQHLWYGRRASARVRTELTAAIYDKALKRKDLSGVDGTKDKDKDREEPNGQQSSKRRKNETKAETTKSADTGKIVQLMSGDAGRIGMTISAAYFIYGAPFEIAIACTFLYQLLGVSAFVGFFVLVVTAPLNHYLSRRNIAIAKELLAARDRRMSLLNELIGAVKFIKFFAWEERWIKRVEDMRKTELRWLVKDRTNSVMFGLLWTCAPLFVSIVSFLTYILLGNTLSVSKAFTAIALFNMLKMPLNVIPHWIVQILQAGVALGRISKFLEEEEVPDYVSTLKRAPASSQSLPEEFLGISNGSFRWNAPKRTQLNGSEGESASELMNEDSEENRFELQDISVRFPEGELTVLTGPTGSGKTAILLALLGEMTPSTEATVVHLPKNTTQVDEHGLMNSISYCAQTPWLEHQSIRENIIFRLPYNEERYQQVLECCALNPDLAIFEDGDETEIGARGVSLSGGQKARVALARAVYAQTKYVLLDDIFAAVDSHTARFLYDNLFQGPLMANRTVILVTHHVELVLPSAYYLIRMGLDGRIDTQGTTKDLRARGVLEAITKVSAVEAEAEEAHVKREDVADAAGIEAAKATDVVSKTATVKARGKRNKLVKEEGRATGNVKWSIYKTYLEASSWWTWGTILPIIVAFQLCNIAEKIWLGIWGNAYDKTSSLAAVMAALAQQPPLDGHLSHNAAFAPMPSTYRDTMDANSLPSANAHPMFYVGVFAAIGLGAALLSTINLVIQYAGAYRASKRLFSRLLATVIHAPMRWFDTTPTGRILNRFSKDVETVDSSLSSSIRTTSQWIASFTAAILTVAFFLPPFLAPAMIIGYFYYKLSLGYVKTGRDLRRIESNTRSPIFSAFGELLEGIVTIRAFSAERLFFDEMHTKVDVTTRMWYSFWMLNRYLLLHFDALGAVSIFITTLFALSGSLSSEMAGVAITSAMTFTTSVYWTCRQITQLEMDLNSVERVVEYLDLPQEPPAIIESHRPPAYWPSSADSNSLVVVEDLEIRYAPDLDPVLHGISFTLKARERVGLLGRTGSGKSTLAMALLRFVEPSRGRIIIDGIDISTIGLQDLRSRLTIIPQDAVLFSGTIRDSLDPFQEHDDSTLRDVLLRVRLISESAHQSHKSSRAASVHDGVDEEIASSSVSQSSRTVTGNDEQKGLITLDSKVSAGGANFSQGQRQVSIFTGCPFYPHDDIDTRGSSLLWRGRCYGKCSLSFYELFSLTSFVMCRQSSVIIMDEATSSIDFKTDAIIQTTIREEFGNSLLITVAHRIRTVVDYDRLIILDKGVIVEFDTPRNLIEKEGGVFRDMCLKSGSFDELKAAALAGANAKVPKLLQ
ncbi:hypothetical protein BOTBODRAFT_186497 [Botryobasidium botryosum FD-172 SS1]|uniref:Multidrug resistance-associated ABC transporter n=1 Tax=Botryobasidium botryosum (strain FD-172 SS1) TaxID=930990 RepID=A0A067ML11_BOTB1|nr:hypothetical protein BOTBODRAFT_186497 [Botryobasidium botryosum FD-172 SS1]